MAVNNYSDYLKQAYENQLKALEKQQQANLHQQQFNQTQAAETKKATNRNAYVDYMRSINPYGIGAEKIKTSGLSGATGYNRRMKDNLYSDYQGALGDASQAYLSSLSSIYNDNIKNTYSNEAAKLGLLSNYQTNLYQEAQRLADLEYQLSRDKITDSQWQKNFDLQKLIAGA